MEALYRAAKRVDRTLRLARLRLEPPPEGALRQRLVPGVAALGDEVEIPTLDGQGKLRIPSGTQPGTVLRVRGKGIPRRIGGRGDQLVEVQVEVPTELNQRQRELIMSLADELGESVQPQRRGFMDKLKDLFQ